MANNTFTVYHKTLQATDIKELNAFCLRKGHVPFLYILKSLMKVDQPTRHLKLAAHSKADFVHSVCDSIMSGFIRSHKLKGVIFNEGRAV